ncbi:capsid portal protein, partial [Salmonella enterica subsp. enterica serovar Weltevreden]|nr:capsid portal protein [Salmonella enterica subsp. enterica serovar Weltevreden]
YWVVNYCMTTQPYENTRGNNIHMMQPDINPEIDGMTGYLSAIRSTLLMESATLLRRKFDITGGHAGFILYMTVGALTQVDV